MAIESMISDGITAGFVNAGGDGRYIVPNLTEACGELDSRILTGQRMQ
ncbi:MAG: hypothetical protein R2741_12470 [Methanolobus sp.]